MKFISKYFQQVTLVMVMVLVSSGIAFARDRLDFTVLISGFLRAGWHDERRPGPVGDDRPPQFRYGYGWSGNFQEWGYGYGYGENMNHPVGEEDLPRLAEYGFDGDDGAVSVDDVITTKTTATITYSTNYLARFAYGYATGYPITEENLLYAYDNNTDYVSGQQTIDATGLNCGTTYYYGIVARDAGNNRWEKQGTFKTKSCGNETISGQIPGLSPRSGDNSSTNHNPRNLRLPPITLALGSFGQDVKDLQTLLNFFGTFLASTGDGSPYHETMTFGQKTLNALKSFQSTFGLNKVDGIYGQETHDVMESFLK